MRKFSVQHIVFTLGFVIIILALVLSGALVRVGESVARVARDVGMDVSDVVLHDVAVALRSKARMADEIVSLRDRNAYLSTRLEGAYAAGGEEVSESGWHELRVWAKPPKLAYDTVMAKVPEPLDMSAGSIIYAAPFVAVGEWNKRVGGSVRVHLFSSVGVETEAVTEGGHTVLLVGQGGGSLVGAISTAAQLSVGEYVYLAQEGFPVMGEIVAIDERESTSEWAIHVSLLANPFTLTHLYVPYDN